VLSASNDGRTIYVKSTPLQWAFDHVPCECMFEQWITLDGPAVVVRNRLTNARSDHTLYPAQDQELPAVYTAGRLGRQFTYEGLVPWTNGPLTEIFGTLPAAVQVLATEHWAANVDASGFGLGVFQPELNTFIAGFHGRRGVGGAFDDDTGYISPIRPEQLDWNIVYDYPYSLVVGTVDEVRAYAVSHRPPAPSWQFTTSREGFSLVNASDTGFPIHDLLRVRLNQADPQVWSPPTFWRAEDVSAVDVRMALHGTSADRAEALWAVDGRGFSGSKRVAIAVVPDGAFHTYRIPLAGAAG
jgi:hypothetical protein